jgi:hypothetical protein
MFSPLDLVGLAHWWRPGARKDEKISIQFQADGEFAGGDVPENNKISVNFSSELA